MNYIILAAGKGTRLHPFTKNYPKCLLYVDEEKTIAQKMIDVIKKTDPSANITYVLGFKHKDIEKSIKGCNIVINPFYEVTNSIASLWFVKELLNNDVVIMNGDIVVSERLMHKIVSYHKTPVVFLDSSIKKNGDYNVQIADERVIVMSKELNDYFGEYAGITKLDKKSASLLREEISKLIDNGHFDQWYENALVQMILNSDFNLFYCDIADYEWHEIDTINDLLKARELCKKEKHD